MDTVANAFRLSLLFGEDKVLKRQGLEQSWKDLETKLASGYPALFYAQIPYLPIYAAAGVHIQFDATWAGISHRRSCILFAGLVSTLTAIMYALTAMYVRHMCGMWRLFCHLSDILLAAF